MAAAAAGHSLAAGAVQIQELEADTPHQGKTVGLRTEYAEPLAEERLVTLHLLLFCSVGAVAAAAQET